MPPILTYVCGEAFRYCFQGLDPERRQIANTYATCSGLPSPQKRWSWRCWAHGIQVLVVTKSSNLN